MMKKKRWRVLWWMMTKPHMFMVVGLISLASCSSDGVRNAVSTVTLDSGSPYGGTDHATSVKIGRSYSIKGKRYHPRYEPHYRETGYASWYGPGFHGRKTANGERYDQYEMTAAHRTLPLPSMVRVTRLDTGDSIIVRVNDRGPFAHGRIIDLSKKAAESLDMVNDGVAEVRVEYLPVKTAQYIEGVGLELPDFMDNAYHRATPPASTSFAAVMNSSRTDDGVERIVPTRTAPKKNAADVVIRTPSDDVVPVRPAVAKSVASDSRFLVQTASFNTYYRAKRYADTLDGLGNSYVSPVRHANDREYRVVLGPLSSYDQARLLLKQTQQLGMNNARILVE